MWDNYPFIFPFKKQTHTQGRRKGVLTQKHITTSLKSLVTFKCNVMNTVLDPILVYLVERNISILVYFDVPF